MSHLKPNPVEESLLWKETEWKIFHGQEQKVHLFATVQYSNKEIQEIAKFYKIKHTSQFTISYIKNKFVENLHIYFKQQK